MAAATGMEPKAIKKLDEVVINKIAAGEVIQRPANALKEMIENSLDAKSSNIQITVKNGGLKLLQIQDDGTGIRHEDFEIVCERFTTSKLREFEDLNSIATYGFRGEALASISHVAHLTIISKTADSKCGYKATYEDGKLKDTVRPIASNRGTQIMIEDLFFNMRVRKNALRNPAEEYLKVMDVVQKYAIHNYKVGFSLKKFGENIVIRTPPNSTVTDNIRTIYTNAIARELIEFSTENQDYKFKAQGYLTNVNYSSKKMQFILFINHRLVDCQSLRKCIDHIYTTYLPKNMHPFIYMSLELDPKRIDVNVHPTKHEVHFLNEEEIVASIGSAVEKKLLGSNNSRIFYTQAKLPGAPVTDAADSSKDNDSKKIHDKYLVRTDSSEQKLEKFFGPTFKKSDVNASVCEIPPTERQTNMDDSFMDTSENKAFLNHNDNFEKELVKVNSTENKPRHEMRKKKWNSIGSSFEKEKVMVPIKLKSVIEMQTAIEDKCDDGLRELFSGHVFVGCVNPRQSLIQFTTKLYLCNTQKIMRELFYQFVCFHFHNLDAIRFTEALDIKQLAKVALDLPETGWSEGDGDKDYLAERVTQRLKSKANMLNEYFSIEIEDGKLKSIPCIIEKHRPDIAGLPMYMLRLATEVNWKQEKECFESFARETAQYYSKMEKREGWEYVTEHVLYPAIKDYFCPSAEFRKNNAVLQIADLPNLYKVFERC